MCFSSIRGQAGEVLRAKVFGPWTAGVIDGEELEPDGPVHSAQFSIFHDQLDEKLLINGSLRIHVEISFKFISGGPLDQLMLPKDLLAQKMALSFNSPNHSDFQLISSDGHTFYVHKTILSLRR